jgi:hypothetical protein
VLSEIGEKNKITVTDDEVSRAVIERARSMPGREKEVWDYYRSNANALAQLRAPIYEDKVVDFILELANVTEKKVTREVWRRLPSLCGAVRISFNCGRLSLELLRSCGRGIGSYL